DSDKTEITAQPEERLQTAVRNISGGNPEQLFQAEGPLFQWACFFSNAFLLGEPHNYFLKETIHMETQKTALLAFSFGTRFHDNREKTIDQIENALAEAFPEAHLYRAWTSGMILKKIQKRDGIHIDNVKEAMERMIADGVTDLIVQPTHVINGIENDQMKEDV